LNLPELKDDDRGAVGGGYGNSYQSGGNRFQGGQSYGNNRQSGYGQ